MAAEVALYMEPERVTPLPIIYLGEVIAPEDFEDIHLGEPIKLHGKNVGTTNLRGVTVALAGDGAENVQLAQDVAGEPGVWAAPGESILISEQTIFAGGNFEFWARGVYHVENAEGRVPLNIVFRATSIG